MRDSKLVYTGNKFFHREISLDSDEFKLYTLIRGFSGRKVIVTGEDNLKLPEVVDMTGKKVLILGDFDKDLKIIFQDNNEIHVSDDVDIRELRKKVIESGKNFPYNYSAFKLNESYDIGNLDYDYIFITTGLSYHFKDDLNLNFKFPVINGVFNSLK